MQYYHHAGNLYGALSSRNPASSHRLSAIICPKKVSGHNVQPVVSVEHCYQPMAPGPCLNSLERFSYNSVTGRCEEFQYGGCGGNRNRFMRVEQCEEECMVAPTTSVAPQTTDTTTTVEPSPTTVTEAMTTSSGNVVILLLNILFMARRVNKMTVKVTSEQNLV